MVSTISQSSFVQVDQRNVAGRNSQFKPSWTRSVTSMGLLPNQSTAARTWPLRRAPQVPSTSPTSRRTRTAELFPLVSETVVSYVPMPLALIRPVMLGQATRSFRAIGSRFSLTVLGESSPVSLIRAGRQSWTLRVQLEGETEEGREEGDRITVVPLDVEALHLDLDDM